MASFVNDPAFVAAHEPPLPFTFKPTTGKDISFPVATGPSGHAFWVAPKAGAKSAIVMIHEWWGLNDYMKREAERLRDQTGYAVLALDLYDGKVATNAGDAGKFMGGVNDERLVAIVQGGLKQLRSGALGFKPSAIGTVGYCFGGGWSHRTAILGGSAVKACVIYYGMPDTRPTSLQRLAAPVLMFEGKKDGWINDKVVAGFQTAMKAAGKSLEVHAYNADHAFANPSNPHFDAAATADSKRRELAFFKAHLS
jgi:carboxymethylenebutenolidase